MPESKAYRVYLADISYFSGKLEAALRYKRIAYQRIKATPHNLVDEVYPNVGLMKVPVVQTPAGLWLKDTTPMLDWFDAEHPSRPVVPQEPVTRLLAKLLEDYADEWLWRPAMYYRWMYQADHRLLSHRIASEVLQNWPGTLGFKAWYFGRRQIKLHLQQEGMRPHNEAHIRQIYLDTLDALETLLRSSRFLLGEQPSIVDYGFFASMFRHFGSDPTPAGIMQQRAPAVYHWLARLWNAAAEPDEPAVNASCIHDAERSPGWDCSQPAWRALFTSIAGDYLPYLTANAKAWQQGKACFDLQLPTAYYPQLKLSQYRCWCLGELQRQYQALTAEEQTAFAACLQQPNIVSVLSNPQIVSSGLEAEYASAVCQPVAKPSRWQRLQLLLQGTPWDKPKSRS